MTISQFSNGESFISGNRCERGLGMARKSKESITNLYDYKYRRTFAYTPLKLEEARRGVMGIPRVLNLEITPYRYSQNQEADKSGERKLLLNSKEIAKLQSYRNQKYMMIPISIFLQGIWFKMEIGIGRKMRKFEKREKIKKKEIKKGLR